MSDEGIDLATGPIGTILGRDDLAGPQGTVTVLVAPPGATCAEFAAALADDPAGPPVRLVEVDDEGGGRCGDTVLRKGDDAAWASLAEASLSAGEAVLVSGPLAEAAAAAVWFSPALSMTDGGSVEEARLRLSATAMRSRMVSGLRGGDFEAIFGASEEQGNAGLSGVVGRIVGYAWDLESGGVIPARVALFPDGLDNLSRNVWLVEPVDGGTAPGQDPEDAPVSGTRGLGDLAERLAEMHRTAYLPILAPPGEPADGRGSRSFGPAFIPAWTLWPRSGLSTLDLVLQMEVADMPEDARTLLGERGALQVFLDLDDPPLEGSKGGFLARIVDTTGAGSYKPSPRTGQGRAPRVVTGWRAVTDAPCGTEFLEGVLREFPMSGLQGEAAGLLDASTVGDVRASRDDVDHAVRSLNLARDDAEAVADALAHHPGDKLLGWPSWEQGADWPEAADGRPMTLLMQLQMYDAALPEGGGLAPGLLAGDGVAQVFVTAEGPPEFAFRWACG